jgi:hypothetical protein
MKCEFLLIDLRMELRNELGVSKAGWLTGDSIGKSEIALSGVPAPKAFGVETAGDVIGVNYY